MFKRGILKKKKIDKWIDREMNPELRNQNVLQWVVNLTDIWHGENIFITQSKLALC